MTDAGDAHRINLCTVQYGMPDCPKGLSQ